MKKLQIAEHICVGKKWSSRIFVHEQTFCFKYRCESRQNQCFRVEIDISISIGACPSPCNKSATSNKDDIDSVKSYRGAVAVDYYEKGCYFS